MHVNIILLCIQVVLESFPVSSSGNGIVMNALLQHYSSTMCTQLTESWYHLLHGPTVIVLGLFFFKKWINYVIQFFRGDVKAFTVLGFCIVADGVTAVWYILFHIITIEAFPLWIGFLVTTVVLASLYWAPRKTSDDLFWHDGFALGMAQGISLLPGISRFAITYAVGRWKGWSSENALEKSFFIQWPLIVAGFLKGLYCVICSGEAVELLRPEIVCSSVISSILAYVALWFVSRVAAAHKMWMFAFYTAFLAMVSLVMNL